MKALLRLPLDPLFVPVVRALVRRPLKTLDVAWRAVLGHSRASSMGPLRLQIELTSVCTFDCLMCNRHNLKDGGLLQKQMDLGLFRKVVEEADPQFVTVTGLGDPLLYPRLTEALRFLKSRRIVVSLTSNLPHLTEARLEGLALYPPDVFSFSLHSGRKEVFDRITGSADFERSIANFERVLARIDRRRTSFRINCALQALNLTDYDSVWYWLRRWKLESRLHLMPVHDFEIANRPGVPRCVPTPAEIEAARRSVRDSIASCRDRKRSRFLRYWSGKLDEMPTNPAPHGSPCSVPWYSMYATNNGDIVPCCYLTRKEHVLGTGATSGLRDVWNGGETRSFREANRTARAGLAGCSTCSRRDPFPIRR